MRHAFRVCIVFAIMSAIGCGQGLPDPTKIEGLRVLAIKAEPPELRSDGPATTRLTPLVVRPGGLGPDEIYWYRCDDWDLNANTFMCPFNGGSHTTLGDRDELDYTVDTARLLSKAAAKAAQQVSGARKEDIKMVLQFIGVWDTVNMGVSTGDEKVESFKRIVVSGPMAGMAAAVISKMPGSEACGELGDDVPPNTNPVLKEVRYMNQETGEAGLLESTGMTVIKPGARLELMPVVDWDTFQEYPRLDLLGDSFACKPVKEFPIVSWFCEAGSLSDRNTASRDRSDGAQLVRLSTIWNIPKVDSVPEGGKIRCWAVLRDGRGGTDWKEFAITVQE
ncbi:MAG: hypothetical protein GXP49_11470 [Deltaproteobacteria bacterium]|nr:hypothetical protein [Deltaproteobacteria bacterium]